MLKVNADNEYKAVERVYSGSTEIDKILDKNGNVLFAVNKEVEGTPALTYKGKEETNLKNYRIYGNTVDGESVGDRSGNLWNEIYDEDGNLHYVPIKVEDGEYTLSTTTPNVEVPGGPPAATIFLLAGNVNTGASTTGNGCWFNNPKTVQSIDGYVTIAYKATESFGEQCYPWNNNTMLNSGSTPLPYEPYGYRVPVTVSNGTDTLTTPIYLPEPLKMVGDEAEYIDYREQKMHKVRKNLFDGEIEQGGYDIYGLNVNNELGPYRVRGTNYIPVVGGETYNLHAVSISPLMYHISYYTKNDYTTRRFGYVGWTQNTVFTTPSDCKYIRLLFKTLEDSVITPDDISNIMLNAGFTALPYEPYIEDTELDVAIPALPTLSGTNTLSVGTEVQPSNVYLKGRIKAISV